MTPFQKMKNQLSDLIKNDTRFTIEDIKTTECSITETAGNFYKYYHAEFPTEKITDTGNLPGFVTKSNNIDSDVSRVIALEKSEFETRIRQWHGFTIESEDELHKADFFRGPYHFGTSWTCETCNGSGVVTCHGCGGHGTITCSSCHGNGKVTCSNCNGHGQTTCMSCYGSKTKYKQEWINGGYQTIQVRCESCSGSGKQTCYPCIGKGKVTCRACSGYGHVTCQLCGGSGTLTCSTCNGTGILHTYKRVECFIQTTNENNVQTENEEHKNELESLEFAPLKANTSMEQISCEVKDTHFQRYYEYTATLHELNFESNQTKENIYGIGPEEIIFNYKNILGALLYRDLARLEDSISQKKRFFFLFQGETVNALDNFFESPVNSEIIEKNYTESPYADNRINDDYTHKAHTVASQAISKTVIPRFIIGMLPAFLFPIATFVTMFLLDIRLGFWALLGIGAIASIAGIWICDIMFKMFLKRIFNDQTRITINKSKSFLDKTSLTITAVFIISTFILMIPTIWGYNNIAYKEYYIPGKIITYQKPDTAGKNNKTKTLISKEHFEPLYVTRRLYHKTYNIHRDFQIPLYIYKTRLAKKNNFFQQAIWHDRYFSENNPGYNYIPASYIIINDSKKYKDLERNIINKHFSYNRNVLSSWDTKKTDQKTINLEYESVKVLVPMVLRLYPTIDMRYSGEYPVKILRHNPKHDSYEITLHLIAKEGEFTKSPEVPVPFVEISAKRVFYYETGLDKNKKPFRKKIIYCYKITNTFPTEYEGMYFNKDSVIDKNSYKFKQQVDIAKHKYRREYWQVFKKFRWAPDKNM